MPWRLDQIGGQGNNPVRFDFEPGQAQEALFRSGKILDEKHWPLRMIQASNIKNCPTTP